MFRIRKFAIASVAVLVVGLLAPQPSDMHANLALIDVITVAEAQEAKKKRRSLFNILFGRKKAKKKAVVKNSNRSRSKRNRSARQLAEAAAAKAVEKREDAKVILVIGDFFASGLAEGLTTALAKVPTLRVVDKSKGLSGFVRNDIVDWSVDLQPLVEEHKPAYVIALLGSNDRQQIRHDGQRLKRQTPEWTAAYTERVKNLGEALKATRLPYAWVGLPPVRFKNMNKDFLSFNEIYAKAAESEQGQFIDVWDGFADADGNYSRSGPDINGQIVLLRSKDGINLTRAGKRRLSYYVEGIIQRLFGGEISGAVGLAGVGLDAENFTLRSPQYDPAKTGKTIVIRLDDPSADGGELLAGEKVEISQGLAPLALQKKDEAFVAAPKVAGRVDNFAWPPSDVQGVAPIAVAAPAPVQQPVLPQSSALEELRNVAAVQSETSEEIIE